MTWVAKLGWWALDYCYVVVRQLGGLWRITPPREFRLTGPSGLDTATTVLLIPGIYERWPFLLPLANRLRDRGERVAVLPELGWNVGEIDAAAEQLLSALRAAGLTGVTIVAHSKGGLIAKAAMVSEAERLARGDTDGEPAVIRIGRLIAIATPFAGSRYATRLPGRRLRAFAPADPTLRRLALALASNSTITSIYPRFDPHIPDGSALTGAVNIELPVAGHFRVLATRELRLALNRELSGGQVAAE